MRKNNKGQINPRAVKTGVKEKAKTPSPTNYEKVSLKTQVNDKLTKINLAAVLIGTVFVITNTSILYMANKKHTNNVYFQVDEDNRIVEIIPVDKPNQSVPAVSDWLRNALLETFHMNFYDYKERLSANTSLYFTQEGGSQLINALEKSRSLQMIEEKEMWLSLTLDNPVFIKRGLANGVYKWHYQVRGQLNRYNVSSRSAPEPVIFDIYIDRMSELERERGLGISRLVMDKI